MVEASTWAMKLTELDATFLRYERRPETPEERAFTLGPAYAQDAPSALRLREFYVVVDSIEQAQGVEFLCPKCFAENNGRVGTHRVICWSRSRGIADEVKPGPGRWTLEGTGLHDLTLNGDGGSRSVLLLGGCAWHGFVTNGDAA